MRDEQQLHRHAGHVLTVCNACRYCEHFCPVFPAIEQRLVFQPRDFSYLANLCHNCGECLYACQYAPPHEFGIDVPATLAQLRHRSYEAYAWPPRAAVAFRLHGVLSASVVTGFLTLTLVAAVAMTNPGALSRPGTDGDFYRVVPHSVMVLLFGFVALAAAVVLAVGIVKCWRDLDPGVFRGSRRSVGRAIRDALSLRHLHDAGADCVTREEQRSPWRRWFHHLTFYGFLLCVASTTVAAIYHASGWSAPYAYTSAPVLLGTAGGLGLVIGPAGLWVLRRQRDPDLTDTTRVGLDDSFLVLLFLTSLTGLLLLVFRHSTGMAWLLIVHLASVLALMLTLPYGKFVHGLYRTIALLKYATETPP